MKQVQIPQELFVQLIHYHLMEDDSRVDEIRIGLEKKWMQWYCVSYTERLRPHRQRRNGKKPGRNIWTGVGYLTVSAGKVSFDGIRQERARPCRLQTRERVMLDDRSTGQKKPE